MPFVGSSSVALLPLKCWRPPHFILDLLFPLYTVSVCDLLRSHGFSCCPDTDDPKLHPHATTPRTLCVQLSAGCLPVFHSTPNQYAHGTSPSAHLRYLFPSAALPKTHSRQPETRAAALTPSLILLSSFPTSSSASFVS